MRENAALHPRQKLLLIDDEAKGPVKEVIALRHSELDHYLSSLPERLAAFVRTCQFEAKAGELFFLPCEHGGTLRALWGIEEAGKNGGEWEAYYFAKLPQILPQGNWLIRAPEDIQRVDVMMGYCLGGEIFSLKGDKEDAKACMLITREEAKKYQRQMDLVHVILAARALITMPANHLGPQELLSFAARMLEQHGADISLFLGESLQREFPLIDAVGAGSSRPPGVILAKWRGTHADENAPLLSLVGKGVCFDTGGLDLKGANSMLKMKKDMGGAASVLALVMMIIKADLPICVHMRLGCVENAISGRAMRPLDVVKSRKGLTVEIGNTDAEGRLVLADLLDAASLDHPSLLIDMATLTGSARSALGPDIPAFFCDDTHTSHALEAASEATRDPLWRLPLWEDYAKWLKSAVADINNTASSPMAGSITAALFLKQFVPSDQKWLHIDSYAWHDTDRPGRPEGGDVFGVRALFEAINTRFDFNKNKATT